MEKKILLKDLQAIIHGNITLVKWNEEAEDYKTLYSTDFLLVNRTNGDIKVFSTQDLIQKLEQTGKYSIKV